MKCITLSVCFLLDGMAAFSQDWTVKKLVTTKRQKKIFFKPIKAFSFTQNKVLKDKGNYKELNLEAGLDTPIPTLPAAAPREMSPRGSSA